MTADAPAVPPDLVCEVRYASVTSHLRQPMSADPYLGGAVDVGERFRFKAVVLGEGGHISNVTLTVYDLKATGAPIVIHQARYLAPFPTSASVPALSGWQHVYSSVLGRELRYGCALQPKSSPAEAAP